MNDNIHIPTNARVFIAGKTGTGKSYFAESYLAGYDYVIKLDTKGEVFERRAKNEEIWRGLKEGKDFSVVEHLQELPQVNTKKIIYAPDFYEQDLDTFDAFFKFVYLRENTIIWIDELMSISNSPLKYPPFMKAVYTRGRSKNVGVWALSQRPADIPAIAPANSEIFVAFDLRLLSDRKKLVDVTGCPEFINTPSNSSHPYAFWYFEDRWDSPVKAELTE